LPEQLFSENPEEVLKSAETLTRPEYLFRVVLEILGLRSHDFLSLLCTLISLLLISAMLHRLHELVPGQSSEGVALVLRLCIYTLLVWQGISMLSQLTSYYQGLSTLTVGLIPMMGTLYAMGGNITRAAAGEEIMMIFLSVCEFVTATATPAVCGICLSLSMMDVFGGGLQIKLAPVAGFIKKWYTVLLGFVMFLLGLALSTRSMLAGGADSLSMKGVKYAVGQMIPIVGGAVSGTLGNISTGLGLIRKITGISGIILVGLLLLPTLIQLLLFRMCYQMASTAAAMLGCDSEGKLLGEMGSLYGYMAAAASICASVCVLALGIFSATAAAFA